jgi:hypothetical protein
MGYLFGVIILYTIKAKTAMEINVNKNENVLVMTYPTIKSAKSVGTSL